MPFVVPTAESTQPRTAVVALERPDYAASIASCVASQVRPVFPAAAVAPSVNVTDALSAICRLRCAALWPQPPFLATMRSPSLALCWVSRSKLIVLSFSSNTHNTFRSRLHHVP